MLNEIQDCQVRNIYVTAGVHMLFSEKELQTALLCTKILYENSTEALLSLEADELQLLFSNAPTTELSLEPGTTVTDILLQAKCFKRQGKKIFNIYGNY